MDFNNDSGSDFDDRLDDYFPNEPDEVEEISIDSEEESFYRHIEEY